MVAYGTLMYLCSCNESSHLGFALMYSMICGVICAALSHSGCKYNLQLSLTIAAYFSAQSKSELLKTTIFNSWAKGITSSNGALNFLGERQIQSQPPT